jgi:ribosome-associated heat shock protein Hsp15
MSDAPTAPASASSGATVRVDKWLWAARMFKSRALATEACDAGHVKLNAQSVKPAKGIRVGDHVEVLTPGGLRILDVLALAEKRGPATEARKLYDDKTPPPEAKDPMLEGGPERDRGLGRPSKRDRRDLAKLRGW